MSKKVLIVEDYQDSRDFMALLTKSFGYQTLTAATGNEAVEIAASEIPDLILMDIGLPVIDGITAIAMIRNFPELAKIPIVAVTAHGYLLASEAVKAGCNDVVDKPLDLLKLESLFKEYLEN